MSERRSYKEVLASVETHILYIREDIGEVKEHLVKLNNSEKKQNVAIAKNSVRVGLIFKIGGAILTVILALTALALGLIKIF